VWIPSQGSTETVVWASHPDRKYPFMVTFSAGDVVARNLNAYRDEARKYGYEPEDGQFGWACPVYVAESDERAREEAGAAVESLFNDFLRMPMEMLIPPGYTSQTSMQNFFKGRSVIGAPKRITADFLIESQTALIGSPRTVRDKIEAMRDKTGLGILLPMFQFGILSDALARRSIEMFAAEVMPHLQTAAAKELA
jgi:alkanesulfonate monooxygenase SsuD/methylene tetrahydromethanopterin reductase-like flavin-dependent oxidoreductase (luciferase family)